MKTKHQPILRASGAKTSSQAIKSTCPIRRGRPALGLSALLLVTVILFLSSPVKGQCPQGWSIHYLDFMQDNQALRNELSLSFQGGRFTGTAMYMTADWSSTVEGKVAGRVSADQIHFEISWSNGLTGVYDATIRPRGQITGGMGYEKRSPSKKVRWSTTRLMECVDVTPSETAPAPVTPKPIKYSGKAKPAPDATKSTSAAADDWINQELRKRKTATQPTPSASNRPRGFINGIQLATPTPTPSAQADE